MANSEAEVPWDVDDILRPVGGDEGVKTMPSWMNVKLVVKGVTLFRINGAVKCEKRWLNASFSRQHGTSAEMAQRADWTVFRANHGV